MADLIVKWEDIKWTPKAVSTVFDKGWFISYDGLGGVIPAQPAALYGAATKILGVILQDITSGDPDFANATDIPFQVAFGNEFAATVTNGVAVAAMVGSRFDVDPTDPGAVDLSAPGTQLEITRVLSATSVLVEVSLVEPI